MPGYSKGKAYKIFNSIDLPAQDGPIIPSESPSLIVNEILTIVFLN